MTTKTADTLMDGLRELERIVRDCDRRQRELADEQAEKRARRTAAYRDLEDVRARAKVAGVEADDEALAEELSKLVHDVGDEPLRARDGTVLRGATRGILSRAIEVADAATVAAKADVAAYIDEHRSELLERAHRIAVDEDAVRTELSDVVSRLLAAHEVTQRAYALAYSGSDYQPLDPIPVWGHVQPHLPDRVPSDWIDAPDKLIMHVAGRDRLDPWRALRLVRDHLLKRSAQPAGYVGSGAVAAVAGRYRDVVSGRIVDVDSGLIRNAAVRERTVPDEHGVATLQWVEPID